jgi:deoxycytidine triphosphate deaminase
LTALSDHLIEQMLDAGHLQLHPLDRAEQLTPNGIDLVCDTVKGQASRWALISTREHIKIPADLCGTLHARTTMLRNGFDLNFGLVDAGFNGNLTFQVVYHGDDASGIRALERKLENHLLNERVCQLTLHALDEPAQFTYEERSGNYQDQEGITEAQS